MFGGGSGSSKTDVSDQKDQKSPSPESGPAPAPIKTTEQAASGEKRSGNGSPPGRQNPDTGSSADKKRRSSGVGSKATSLINAAKNSLISANSRNNSDAPLEKLGKQDPALAVPQGSHNNSAGESVPGPRSTFRVGVWEDRNKKCRRTMEDTHAFLYNFLATPAPTSKPRAQKKVTASDEPSGMIETDNGYFAIFDGHAGTFAADWCGKKLHIILEEIIRKNPNQAVPILLDESFTAADEELAKLPVKNSGCTAAIALLRWEDRVPTSQSVTGSQGIASALAAEFKSDDKASDGGAAAEAASARLKAAAARQRVLYTANVGDARIILCRDGKALRLSYDHKGSDENESKRIENAGGLILNNRVNGVLAVTRALGDSYMKELVTGHPYTTETVIKPDLDEFILIACDGLWDVCSDQEAVDLVRNIQDPVAGSKLLVDHALSRFSTDNLSCMIVRFDRDALREAHATKNIGVEGDPTGGQLSEAEKIVNYTKQQIAEGGLAIGVSGPSNSGKVHEPIGEQVFKPTIIEGAVQEEPATMDTEGIASKPAPESKEDKKFAGVKQNERMPDLKEEEPTVDAGDKDKIPGKLPS